MFLDSKKIDKDANDLQLKTIVSIRESFKNYEVKNEIIESSTILGSRGKYDGKELLQIIIKFEVLEYSFEMFLYYDQIEYYITNSKGILAECNIEDFYSFKEMVNKYESYLIKDIKRFLCTNNEADSVDL